MSSRDTSLHPDRLSRLRGHLMTEIATQPAPAEAQAAPIRIRRWTPRRLAVASAAIAAGTAAVFVGLAATSGPGGLGPTAFAVTPQPHGVVAIHIVNTQASADEMTRQLQAKGLNIKIATMAATPALVGTWVAVGSDGTLPDSVAEKVNLDGYAATLDVPASFPGLLILDVGVAPKPGQPINVAGLRNALAPGGPLACHGLSGAKPEDAEKILASLGYTIDQWTTRQPTFRPGVTPEQSGVVAVPPPGTRVTQVWVHDWIGTRWDDIDPSREHNVVVQVQAPKAATYTYAIWQGFASSLRTGNPATAGC
jgi:hypothetical protein